MLVRTSLKRRILDAAAAGEFYLSALCLAVFLQPFPCPGPCPHHFSLAHPYCSTTWPDFCEKMNFLLPEQRLWQRVKRATVAEKSNGRCKLRFYGPFSIACRRSVSRPIHYSF